MKLKYLILLSSALLAPPLHAQEEDAADDLETLTVADALPGSYITVLANGSLERLDWTGESISVFDRDDMDAVQGADLSRLLERAPGVTLSRNGGPGTTASSVPPDAIRADVRSAEGEPLDLFPDLHRDAGDSFRQRSRACAHLRAWRAAPS